MRGRLAAVVLAALVAAGFAFTHHTRKTSAHLAARLEAAANVDISDSRGAQSEVALAVDPADARRLLAGSNDISGKRMRLYESRDGGRRWTHAAVPLPRGAGVCAASDPTVAIGVAGRRFYAFVGIHCSGRRASGSDVYVAEAGHGRAWRTRGRAVAHSGRLTLFNDRPNIAVDTARGSPHRGRLYAAWTRFSLDPSAYWADPDEEDIDFIKTEVVVSHSDDAGRVWAKPTTLRGSGSPHEIRLAVGLHGALYAVWRDVKSNAIFVARSRDGGKTFSRGSLVAAADVRPERSCHSARARIPAQPRRCVSSNPVIATDTSSGPRAGTVYVVWNSTALNLSQDVDVAAYDGALHPQLGVGRVQQVSPPEGIRGPDQFLPTAAVDPANGRLWACYYQSVGRSRRGARFTCTASDDGALSWRPPVAAASKVSNESRHPANVANGFGDYEAVAASGGQAFAAWTDGRRLRPLREEIYLARLTQSSSRVSR
jgi:hypothetical protein